MSTTESYSARSGNPGLEALVTLLHLQGVAADAGQIRHRLGTDKIPVIQPRVDIRKTLVDKQLGSTLTYFETLQLLVEQQQELSVQKSHLRAAESAAAAIRETSRQAVAEYRHALSDELAKAVQKRTDSHRT